MHVTDVALGVYKQNLNAELLQQHHFGAGLLNGNISSSRATLYQAKAGVRAIVISPLLTVIFLGSEMESEFEGLGGTSYSPHPHPPPKK